VDGRLPAPLLFHAHHTAELAIKAALIPAGVAFEPKHGLGDLWAALVDEGTTAKLSIVDVGWCRDYVALVADLAGNSVGARYARPNKGHSPIDDTWCCVSPRALAAATEHFAIQCIAVAQEVAEAVPTQR
jgi:HEPN domain-containing protein